MNILVIAHYQGDGSPSASFVHDQVKAYCALGHVVRVVTPLAIGKRGFQSNGRCNTEQREIDGVRYFYLRFLSLSNWGKRAFNTYSAIYSLHKNLSLILDGFRPDVIHAHTLGFDSELGKWLKKKLGVPLVVTTHGSDTTVLVNSGRLDELRGYCEGVDAVVAVSHTLADRLRTCGTNVPVKAIHNGFNNGHLAQKQEKEPLTFLQVGNLIELKQIPVTIRAFEIIYRKYPQARLTIIGQGPDREDLEKLCSDLKIADVVIFTGQLPHAEVLEHMSRTQFFIMPSVREGFGVVYLEAMASGCITVGTATEGIAEIIRHGENGFLVQPGDADAIAELMFACVAAPEMAERIANNGRQTADELTWLANARKVIALFNSLLEEMCV